MFQDHDAPPDSLASILPDGALALPYVEGQFERKVFTHLVGDKAPELNDLLTQGGFRRSQNIAYRPACEQCRSCVSVRILAGEFEPTRNMRRVMRRNADLIGAMHDAEPSTEQYSLFRHYLARAIAGAACRT
jgi:arginine-tRNA-protein transferase